MKRDPLAMAKGKHLDNMGYAIGIKRKIRKWWLFTIRENDRSYRGRMLAAVRRR